jgi:hypothetical protein
VSGLKPHRGFESPSLRQNCLNSLALVRGALFIFALLLARSAAAQSPVDLVSLDRLIDEAKAQRSNALFVHQHGLPVREALFDSKDKRVYLY